MSDRSGFFRGLLIGGVAGFALSRYLATDEGRQRLDTIRSRTIELTGDPEQLRQRAVTAATTVGGAVSEAVLEGISAARQRRQELAQARKIGGGGEPQREEP